MPSSVPDSADSCPYPFGFLWFDLGSVWLRVPNYSWTMLWTSLRCFLLPLTLGLLPSDFWYPGLSKYNVNPSLTRPGNAIYHTPGTPSLLWVHVIPLPT
ncbi:hypothetical protein FKM82_026914 [Ascaphus truei]